MVSSLWSVVLLVFGVAAALAAPLIQPQEFTTTFHWTYPTPSVKVATFGPQDWTTFVVTRTNDAGELYPQTVTAPRNRPTAISISPSTSGSSAQHDGTDDEGGGLDVAAIVCLVVFPVAAAAAAGFFLCYLVRRRRLAASAKAGDSNEGSAPNLAKDRQAHDDDDGTLCGDDSKSVQSV